MAKLFASVNGRRVIAADIRLPWQGVWSADLTLDEAGPALSGAVTIEVGGLTLRGTVDLQHGGEFANARELRVLGGAGGWGTELPPRSWHNDAGVKVSEVLRAAATEAGETVALGAGVEARLGPDYIRERGPASAAFMGAAPAAAWWVDTAGVTQVATARPTAELAKGADVEVLDLDALEGTAELAGDPAAVPVGTILRDGRLAAPLVVRELAIVLDETSLRMSAYSRSDGPGGRLLDPLMDMMRGVRDERLPGLYRYRVVAMSGDRVKLQAVTRGRWPDVLPCPVGAGIAGGWASPALGSIVLVAFQDEDRAHPVIVSATPKGQPGHLPTIAALDGQEVRLGGAAAAVHRVGDKGAGGTFTLGPAGAAVIYSDPDGTPLWSIAATAGGAPVVFALTPVGDPTKLGKVITKAGEGSPKVKA